MNAWPRSPRPTHVCSRTCERARTGSQRSAWFLSLVARGLEETHDQPEADTRDKPNADTYCELEQRLATGHGDANAVPGVSGTSASDAQRLPEASGDRNHQTQPP